MQKFIQNIILKAGKMLLKEYGSTQAVEEKNSRELVTETDKKIEEFLKHRILKRFPHHQIIGEEGDIVNPGHNSHIWYIDPIDGTNNFIQTIPVFGICIGYELEGSMINGAVYFPVLRELFKAERHGGAFKNKQRIYSSKRTELMRITAGTGFSCIRSGNKNPC